jgi:protein-S-isoprenylcysteine O-methyltransferase Ste14
MMPRPTTNIPAPIVAIVAGGMMKLYADAAGIPLDANPVLAEVGILIGQLSAVIALLALISFGLARTTIDPIHPSRASTLVTNGIFRVSRNPLCLSLLLLLISYALRLDSWVVWLGPVLFASYITRFQIIPEEAVLAAKFGTAFQDYKRHTRRWI